MKIAEITSQYRRDLTLILECESCGHMEENVSGYDDANYHQNVIPKRKCEECGEAAPADHRPLAPKYNENQTV